MRVPRLGVGRERCGVVALASIDYCLASAVCVILVCCTKTVPNEGLIMVEAVALARLVEQLQEVSDRRVTAEFHVAAVECVQRLAVRPRAEAVHMLLQLIAQLLNLILDRQPLSPAAFPW